MDPEGETINKVLKLLSPATGKPLIYKWPLTSREILLNIRLVCADRSEFEGILTDYVSSMNKIDITDFSIMKEICEKFNKTVTIIKKLEKGTWLGYYRSQELPHQSVLREVMKQIYEKAVTKPAELNKYRAFSPSVYGETNFDLISQVLDLLNLTPNDIFLDLGSGVGQVVLQVAASCKLKMCYGIEKAEVPAFYAEQMEEQYKSWFQWFGRGYGKFQLIKGDFLDPQFRELIENSSVIFVNNFAFGPNIDHQLKEIFINMKDGTRIVSSKNFCPINSRVTTRNCKDLESIMHVSEICGFKDSVSWTGAPVTFYIHVIDRMQLNVYLDSIQLNNEDSKNEISPRESRVRKRSTIESDEDFRGWKNKKKEEKKEKPRKKPLETIGEEDSSQNSNISGASDDTHVTNSLDMLLENYRVIYMQHLETMRSPEYVENLKLLIEREREKREILKHQIELLETEIQYLTEEESNHLSLRLHEARSDVTLCDFPREYFEEHKALMFNTEEGIENLKNDKINLTDP